MDGKAANGKTGLVPCVHVFGYVTDATRRRPELDCGFCARIRDAVCADVHTSQLRLLLSYVPKDSRNGRRRQSFVFKDARVLLRKTCLVRRRLLSSFLFSLFFHKELFVMFSYIRFLPSPSCL